MADHHPHDFDGEPATQLPADEPRTPGWVPLVGLALFAVGALTFLARGAGSAEAPSGAAPAPIATAAAAAPRPAADPAAAQQPVRPMGSGTAAPRGSLARPNLTPEQAEQLKKRVEEARKRREAAGMPQPALPGGQ